MITADLTRVQVWVASTPIGMRKSFDGLAEVVRSFLRRAPLVSQQPLALHTRLYRQQVTLADISNGTHEIDWQSSRYSAERQRHQGILTALGRRLRLEMARPCHHRIVAHRYEDQRIGHASLERC
jgi:hypothetical protein